MARAWIAERPATQWPGERAPTGAHMGYNQEAYDAECAALARGLKEAKLRQPTPDAVTIFTDAQAAIRRMTSEEPGPGQQYAIEARQHVAALKRARPDIRIEIRWCPAHKGVPGNEKADAWAKLAADEPDAHGVEWLAHADGTPAVLPVPRRWSARSRALQGCTSHPSRGPPHATSASPFSSPP